jgi:hypothetical protein
MPSHSGTPDEAAAFFRVDRQTIYIWMSDQDPKTHLPKDIELAHWKEGRNIMIDEEAIVARYVQRYRAAGAMTPAQIGEQGRKLWLNHLKVVQGEYFWQELCKWQKRLESLEHKLKEGVLA